MMMRQAQTVGARPAEARVRSRSNSQLSEKLRIMPGHVCRIGSTPAGAGSLRTPLPGNHAAKQLAQNHVEIFSPRSSSKRSERCRRISMPSSAASSIAGFSPTAFCAYAAVIVATRYSWSSPARGADSAPVAGRGVWRRRRRNRLIPFFPEREKSTGVFAPYQAHIPIGLNLPSNDGHPVK